MALRREQINQAHPVGKIVRLQLQDTPVGSNGIIHTTIDDVGIDENSVFGDSLLYLALAYVDFAQHLVDIQVLRSHIDHTQAFFGGRCQQAVVDVLLNILH